MPSTTSRSRSARTGSPSTPPQPPIDEVEWRFFRQTDHGIGTTEELRELLEGPRGLGPLWMWTIRRFDSEGATDLALREPLPDDDPQLGPRPPWHAPDRPNPYLSDGALWLVEGLGCHLSMLVIAACPEARWDVYRAPSSTRDVNQNRTMLHGLPNGAPADPSSMVYSQVIKATIHAEPWAADALDLLYRHLTGAG